MKRSIEDTSIVMVGAGNLATNLAKALYKKGFRIVQVYSRTEGSAARLASVVEADHTTDIAHISKDAELYIVALTDTALIQLAPQLAEGREHGLWLHTAGSVPVDVWKGHANRYGVFYPMQTFSKAHEVSFDDIPIFYEASTQADARFIHDIASVLSQSVYETTSQQRCSLHLAAVFTCNFTNRMYALAAELLKASGLPFEVMLPLVDETANKVHQLSPAEAQTGPAVRNDEEVIKKHMQLLSDRPDLQELYRLISKNIQDNR